MSRNLSSTSQLQSPKLTVIIVIVSLMLGAYTSFYTILLFQAHSPPTYPAITSYGYPAPWLLDQTTCGSGGCYDTDYIQPLGIIFDEIYWFAVIVAISEIILFSTRNEISGGIGVAIFCLAIILIPLWI